jgi:hypothetical protein
MNGLCLLNRGGMLEDGAALTIYSHIIYPNDPVSRRQVLLVAMDERERFLQAKGLTNWRPSALSQKIVTAMNGEAGQRAVAGYTAIAFALLRAKNPRKSPTLYAASNVVFKALKRASKNDPRPLKMLHLRDTGWEVEGQSCPTTRGGIATAWMDFCTVSHLIAADSILSEWLPVQSIFERTPEFSILLLKTASIFEPHLIEPIEERHLQLLEVRHQFVGELSEIPPIPMGAATVDFLKLGMEK